MNKQYFLLVKSFTGSNSKPIEKALVNKLVQTLDQTFCNKSMHDLNLHLKDIMVGCEKEFKDVITIPLVITKTSEREFTFICLGLFKITAFEVRNANPRYHVQMPADFLPRKWADWNQLSKQEQNQRIELEMKKVSAFLDGSNPQANCMITTFQKEFEGWKIELIDFVHEPPNPDFTSADFGVKFKEVEGKEAPNG